MKLQKKMKYIIKMLRKYLENFEECSGNLKNFEAIFGKTEGMSNKTEMRLRKPWFRVKK